MPVKTPDVEPLGAGWQLSAVGGSIVRLAVVAHDESVLVVPLRSNAHTLLTGGPVAAMRRRLKHASLLFDALYLDSGIVRADEAP